ncbi:PAS domain S-box protein [Methanofollis ethanolicus]|uniref:PAS domain S-box protein n=1 Tax=Methanofollis ethanolicus TaxID=488124 RepID=UPI000831DCBE|nr:PAS domain S-box protein [Methanofollis ethanolicus]
MRPYPEEIPKILERLKANPRGMSVTDLAGDLGINRNTVSRYLDMLLIAGEVEMRTYGKAKVFYPSQRVPLSAMINFASDGVVILDRNLTIVQANDRVLAIAHAGRDEVIGKTMGESALSAFDHPLIRSRIDDALGGEDVVEEIRFLQADGEFFFRMKILPTAFNDGNPGITIILEDITEQKESEEALRAGEAKFRALVEDINDIIWNLDSDQAFTYVSPKSFDLLGYAPEEMEGHSLLDFVPEKEREKIRTKFSAPFASGEPFSLLSIPILHRNGHHLIFEASGTPDFDEIGDFAGYRMVARDVTERQQAERRVRGWKSFLHCIVQNIPDMVFVKEIEGGSYVFFNRSAEAFAGGTSEKLTGKKDDEIFPPDLVPFMTCGEKEVLAEMKTFECPETAVSFRCGEKRYLQAKKIPIAGSDGTMKYILTIICDVTTHVRADALLRSQRDLALALGSAATLGEALALCLGAAVQAAGTDAGAVYMTDDGSGDLVLAATSGVPPAFAGKMRRFDAGTPAASLLSGPASSSWKAGDLPDLDPSFAPLAEEGIAGVAAVPVMDGDRLMAVFLVASRRHTEIPAYGIRALETTTAQVANVIGRIRAQETVKTERDRAQRYLDVARVMIAVIGPDGTIERMNRMGCRILGYEEEEIAGKNWFAALVPAHLRPRLETNFKKIMAGEVVLPDEEESPVLGRGGDEVCILWHNAIVRDDTGTITGMVSSGTLLPPSR